MDELYSPKNAATQFPSELLQSRPRSNTEFFMVYIVQIMNDYQVFLPHQSTSQFQECDHLADLIHRLCASAGPELLGKKTKLQFCVPDTSVILQRHFVTLGVHVSKDHPADLISKHEVRKQV